MLVAALYIVEWRGWRGERERWKIIPPGAGLAPLPVQTSHPRVRRRGIDSKADRKLVYPSNLFHDSALTMVTRAQNPTLKPMKSKSGDGIAVQLRGQLLIVPIEDGVADLSRGFVLNPSAFAIWESLRKSKRTEEVWAELARSATISTDQAKKDVESLVADLAKLGLDPKSPVEVVQRTQAAEESPTTGSALSSHDMEELAKAVLSTSNRLRFKARGRSMRPTIPDGSILEIQKNAFSEVRKNDIILYSAGTHRLVAHRVLRRKGDILLARGDSSLRIDRVEEGNYLGSVIARISSNRGGETRTDLTSTLCRAQGIVSGRLFPLLVILSRPFISWIRKSFERRSICRGILHLFVRGACWAFFKIERLSFRISRRLWALRAALLSPEEKVEMRRKLYEKWSIQEFTSLAENVNAGLTLIEETLVSRHPISGKALVVGCGPGREAIALTKLGCEVVGMDYQEAMLERARKEAKKRGLNIRFELGEADNFSLPIQDFDYVVGFSGIYNMLLPRKKRLSFLESAKRHLKPGGKVLLTFLTQYVSTENEHGEVPTTFLSTLNPYHEQGDLILINEAVHVIPRRKELERETLEAGFTIEMLYRDQRAFDRVANQVKSFAILVRSS